MADETSGSSSRGRWAPPVAGTTLVRSALAAAFVLPALACGTAARPPADPVVRPAAADATPPPAPDSTTGVRIGIPGQVAAFSLHSRRDYEDRALGTQLRYMGPDSLFADVYVYPGPDFGPGCDSTCAADVFARELAQFTNDFPEMVRRQYYDSIAVAGESSLPPGPGRPWRLGRHLRLAVTRDGKPARSDFHLFYLPVYRVKVRVTYDPTPPRTQALEAFMRELMPLLTGTPASRPPS